jgi:hypothetical protein
MIYHRQLAERLSFMDLTAISLSLFLVDCRIKSTGTLIDPKAIFLGSALELSRSPRPRVFLINTLLARLVGPDKKSASQQRFFSMEEKPLASPSSASPGSVKEKI